MKYFLPTKIIAGTNCIINNASEFSLLGTNACIITGCHSAKENGSLRDVTSALKATKISYTIYDKVPSDPSIEFVYAAAKAVSKTGADFIIGIGGGSALDAAKAITVLAVNAIDETTLFSGNYPNPVLPLAAVPTTAGTGSEVTEYSILTNDGKETKTSIANTLLFPKVAFLDESYTLALPKKITINTAIDTLSHAMEGYLSVNATVFSNTFAEQALRLLAGILPRLTMPVITSDMRKDLLYASTMSGIVIANTATTLVHAMGYSLTYYKHMAHGRANGLLLTAYLRLLDQQYHVKVQYLLCLLNLPTIDAFETLMHQLLGTPENITASEITLYSDKALQSWNIHNTLVPVDAKQISILYEQSLHLV